MYRAIKAREGINTQEKKFLHYVPDEILSFLLHQHLFTINDIYTACGILNHTTL